MKTILVTVILLYGEGVIQGDDLKYVLMQTKEKFQEAGIKLVYHKKRHLRDESVHLNTLATRKERYKALLRQVKRDRRLTVRAVNLVIGPPFVGEGRNNWIAGNTITGAYGSRGIAYAALDPERLDISAMCVTHEIGHDLGAYHTEEMSIMNVGVLDYVGSGGVVGWSKESIEQMMEWIEL